MHALGALYIFFYKALYHRHSMLAIQLSHIINIGSMAGLVSVGQMIFIFMSDAQGLKSDGKLPFINFSQSAFTLGIIC